MDFAAIFTALKPFLPLLAPLIIAAVKSFAPKIIDAIPALYKPIVSAAIGVLIGWLSGLDTGTALATAASMGFAGSKVRDMFVGKPGACASL